MNTNPIIMSVDIIDTDLGVNGAKVVGFDTPTGPAVAIFVDGLGDNMMIDGPIVPTTTLGMFWTALSMTLNWMDQNGIDITKRFGAFA